MKNQQMNLNQLLDVVGPDLAPSADKLDSVESKCAVKLEEKELWIKFKEYTNEMIVTKNGRYVKLFLSDLLLLFCYTLIDLIRLSS